MKYRISIDCEDDEDFEIIKSARANYFLLQDLYNSVFRPVIKYSQDYELVDSYEKVWAKVSEYLEGEK